MANTTLDPANCFSGITLSGSNLIATCTTIGGGVRAIDGLTSGKYYYEATLTVLGGTGITAVGLCNGIFSLSTITGINAAYANASGTIALNGAQYIAGWSFGALTTGMTICVAVDLDNGYMWLRINATGNWNSVAGADPTKLLSGMQFNILGDGPAFKWYPVITLNRVNDKITMNFGDSAFVGAPPVGYTAGWPAGSGTGPSYAATSQAFIEHWTAGATPPAQLTQITASEWGSPIPTDLLTSVAVEEWASGNLPNSAILSNIAIEEWASAALVRAAKPWILA